MIGRHIVKAFPFNTQRELELPEGWKPFGFVPRDSRRADLVICRKWVRSEKEQFDAGT